MQNVFDLSWGKLQIELLRNINTVNIISATVNLNCPTYKNIDINTHSFIYLIKVNRLK